MPPPLPPENNTTRNIIIGIIVALLLILILGAAYVATRPQAQPSFPVIIPTATPAAAEPTRTPKPTSAPDTVAPVTEAPATDPARTRAPDNSPAQPPATEAGGSPGATTIPGTEDQEIVIGNPVVIGDPNFSQVALMTQNVSDQVKSYSLKGTFKNGNTITATATGFVSDHLPGTIRTPTLYIDSTPGSQDTLTVAIDTMLSEDPSTPTGDVAQAVTFGPPTITTGDIATVDVEVTNGSQSNVSLVVDAGVLRDGVLVGVGSGTVSDMSVGQTKTATIYITGDIAVDDQLILTVDTVLIAP
jgi:hypothetical protein